MGFNEFKELWDALSQWKAAFLQSDGDHSGTVEPHELHQALVSFGMCGNQLGSPLLKLHCLDGVFVYWLRLPVCFTTDKLCSGLKKT